MKASLLALSALLVWAAVSVIGQTSQDEPKVGEDKSSIYRSATNQFGSATNQFGSSTNSYGSSTNLSPTSTNKLPRIYGTNAPSEGSTSTNSDSSDIPK